MAEVKVVANGKGAEEWIGMVCLGTSGTPWNEGNSQSLLKTFLYMSEVFCNINAMCNQTLTPPKLKF